MKKSLPSIVFVFLTIGMALSLIWRKTPSSYLFALSQIFNLLGIALIMIHMARNSPPLKRIQIIIVTVIIAFLAAVLIGAFVFRNSIDRLLHSLGIYNSFLPWVIAAILFICLVWFIAVSLKPKTR